MKKIIVMIALAAFACTASAHCGNCEADAEKPKTECKGCKDCKDACKCKCHKASE